jgi:outer membrane protein TolC
VITLSQRRDSNRIDVAALSRLAAMALSVLLISYAPPASAQETRRDASPSTRDDGMPERLRRQIAPNPSTLWQPPALGGYTSVLKAGERVPIDPQKRYDLVELIDLAQRTNPETRVAWERARQAAIAIGLVQSEYFPVLALAALGGYKSVATPAPKDVAPSGFFRVDLEQVVPVLNLRWLLLDFGRRGSALDAAKERLLSANLGSSARFWP